MNYIAIDCEFNSFKGELISLALVADNGEEFYEVLSYDHMDIDPWVQENVIPVLEKEPVSMFEFQHKLERFLRQFRENGCHIFADWVEDISHLCSATIVGPGLRISLPKKFTMEVCPWIEAESKVPHNALWDARAIMEMWLEKQLLDGASTTGLSDG